MLDAGDNSIFVVASRLVCAVIPSSVFNRFDLDQVNRSQKPFLSNKAAAVRRRTEAAPLFFALRACVVYPQASFEPGIPKPPVGFPAMPYAHRHSILGPLKVVARPIINGLHHQYFQVAKAGWIFSEHSHCTDITSVNISLQVTQ